MVEVLICTEQWLKSEVRINERGVSTIHELLAEQEEEDELTRGNLFPLLFLNFVL